MWQSYTCSLSLSSLDLPSLSLFNAHFPVYPLSPPSQSQQCRRPMRDSTPFFSFLGSPALSTRRCGPLLHRRLSYLPAFTLEPSRIRLCDRLQHPLHRLVLSSPEVKASRFYLFFPYESHPNSSFLNLLMDLQIKSVPTKPIEGQKTGTSGLRKKVLLTHSLIVIILCYCYYSYRAEKPSSVSIKLIFIYDY